MKFCGEFSKLWRLRIGWPIILLPCMWEIWFGLGNLMLLLWWKKSRGALSGYLYNVSCYLILKDASGWDCVVSRDVSPVPSFGLFISSGFCQGVFMKCLKFQALTSDLFYLFWIEYPIHMVLFVQYAAVWMLE